MPTRRMPFTATHAAHTRLGRVRLHAAAICYEITRCLCRLWFHAAGICREFFLR